MYYKALYGADGYAIARRDMVDLLKQDHYYPKYDPNYGTGLVDEYRRYNMIDLNELTESDVFPDLTEGGWTTCADNSIYYIFDHEKREVVVEINSRRHGIPSRALAKVEPVEVIKYDTNMPEWGPWETLDDHIRDYNFYMNMRDVIGVFYGGEYPLCDSNKGQEILDLFYTTVGLNKYNQLYIKKEFINEIIPDYNIDDNIEGQVFISALLSFMDIDVHPLGDYFRICYSNKNVAENIMYLIKKDVINSYSTDKNFDGFIRERLIYMFNIMKKNIVNYLINKKLKGGE